MRHATLFPKIFQAEKINVITISSSESIRKNVMTKLQRYAHYG